MRKKNWGSQKPPLGSTINWSHPLSSGLVGCWLMNEGGGNNVNDLIKNNNATNTNAVWKSAVKGKCLDFDGTTAALSTGIKNIPYLGAITVVTMFSMDVVQGKIVARWADLATDRYNWLLQYAATNKVSFYQTTTTGLAKPINYSTTTNTFTTGQPVFVTASSAYGVSMQLFMNGVFTYGQSLAFNSSGVSDQTVATTSVTIGAGEASPFDGYIDGQIYFVYIYNRILTASEVKELYANPYQFINRPQSKFFPTPPSVSYGIIRRKIRW